jgi:hypothetical protein
MNFVGTYTSINGKFSVSSLYNAIIQSDLPVKSNKKIWKIKIPLKTKILDGICVEELS